ncbi:MAG: AMP-binding protein, partial [Trebonia sp.]
MGGSSPTRRCSARSRSPTRFRSRSTPGCAQPLSVPRFRQFDERDAAGRAGDRVAILADTRLEWTLTSYGVSVAGGIVVPIYPTSSA